MITMKQAQAQCRRWKTKGDKRSLAAAARLEAKFRKHPDYESDQAFFLRVQSGEFQRELYWERQKKRRS